MKAASRLHISGAEEPIKAVIFDVDGTLYNQSKLRRLMILEMLGGLLFNPSKIKDFQIIYTFRKLRESNFERPTAHLEEDQYAWTAEALRMDSTAVRRVVEEWIYEKPLRHLISCRYPGLKEFVECLHQTGVKTAVFSDYPAQSKLDALEISVQNIVCATDMAVNRLKPDPKGLQLVCQNLQVNINSCVFIGDRMDRDGECAKRIGMPFLILNKRGGGGDHCVSNYYELLELFKA